MEEDNQLFSGGKGTKESPYLISTVDDFVDIENHTSSHFKQVNDINLEGVEIEQIGSFSGSYDGCNYSLSNLKPVKTYSYEKLILQWIRNLNENACLRRINFDNAVGGVVLESLEGSVISDCSMVGGTSEYAFVFYCYGKIMRCSASNRVITGYAGLAYNIEKTGLIKDCYAKHITFRATNSRSYFAGAVAFVYGRAINCYSHDITFDYLYDYNYKMQIGGFAIRVSGYVEGCFSSDIRADSAENDTRGIGGFCNAIEDWSNMVVIKDCYSYDISLNQANKFEVGGFVAINHGRENYSFINCYADKINLIVNYPKLVDMIDIGKFMLTNKWNIDINIQEGSPYIRRFWEGTDLPIEENPWTVDLAINDGMPYLKKLIDPQEVGLEIELLTDVIKSANPIIRFKVVAKELNKENEESENVEAKQLEERKEEELKIIEDQRVDFRITSYDYTPPESEEDGEGEDVTITPFTASEGSDDKEKYPEESLTLSSQFSTIGQYANLFKYKKEDSSSLKEFESRGNPDTAKPNLKEIHNSIFEVKLPVTPSQNAVIQIDSTITNIGKEVVEEPPENLEPKNLFVSYDIETGKRSESGGDGLKSKVGQVVNIGMSVFGANSGYKVKFTTLTPMGTMREIPNEPGVLTLSGKDISRAGTWDLYMEIKKPDGSFVAEVFKHRVSR